jgi:hypothetical protein
VKPITITRAGNWWRITARCVCGCGVVARSVLAKTLKAAIWRHRFLRKEAAL